MVKVELMVKVGPPRGFAALWLADNIGSFFEGGGAAFYHSPIQPQPVQDSCLGPASWSNFVTDRDYNITGYTSPYWGARMIATGTSRKSPFLSASVGMATSEELFARRILYPR